MDQVTGGERPIPGIHKEVILATHPVLRCQMLPDGPYGRRGDEGHPILPALARTDEEAAFLRVPVLDQKPDYLART